MQWTIYSFYVTSQWLTLPSLWKKLSLGFQDATFFPFFSSDSFYSGSFEGISFYQPMIVGTKMLNPGPFPGFSLHSFSRYSSISWFKSQLYIDQFQISYQAYMNSRNTYSKGCSAVHFSVPLTPQATFFPKVLFIRFPPLSKWHLYQPTCMSQKLEVTFDFFLPFTLHTLVTLTSSIS